MSSNGMINIWNFTNSKYIFDVFSYCYGAVRLSALSKHKVLFVFTHDSFYVGEDGPTHQPIESLGLLHGPNLYVFRPGDANELIGCYHEALKYICS